MSFTSPEQAKVVPATKTGSRANVAFTVKNARDESKIVCDALALGLYGKGTLGCELELLGLPKPHKFAIAPADSGLAIDTSITFDVVDDAGNAIAPSAVRIGTGVKIRPTFSSLFNGKSIAFSLGEVGVGSGGEVPTAHTYEWKVSNVTAPEQVVWWVGNGFTRTPSLDYRKRELTAATDRKLEYQFRATVKDVKNQKPREGVLVRVPKPTLTSFTLTMESGSELIEDDMPPVVVDTLKAEGVIEGVAADWPLPLTIELYARCAAGANLCHQRLCDWKLEPQAPALATSRTTVPLSENRFSTTLLLRRVQQVAR